MRVRMKSIAAGPDGNPLMNGHEYDLPDQRAENFIQYGFAEAVKPKPVAPPVESAAVEPAPENAAKPRPKRRPRKVKNDG